MKIAFVYDAVYPWVRGGAEKRIYEIGRRLAALGHEVHVFGIKWWKGADIIEKEGMILHGVSTPVDLYVNGRRSISEAIIFSLKLLPHLIREKFDVIDVCAFPYFSCFSARVVSSLRRTPMMITWHEVWADYWFEYLGSYGIFGKLIELTAARLTAKSIAVSDFTGKRLGLLGVSSKNIRIVPNGIDLDEIARIAASNDKCDIIFAGRLIREKNVDLLLDAVDLLRKKLPDLKCLIIGDGPERERLFTIAEKNSLLDNVRFSGFMEYDEVIARIKSAKAFVLPSSREGFAMVVIEAFACGVPVVTVRGRQNAASELINDSRGKVVNRDARELSEAISALITEGEGRENLARSAIGFSKDFDWDKIVLRLVNIYEEWGANARRTGK